MCAQNCDNISVKWSFGVTSWEVFSLGRTPYAGVDPFSLMSYLERGERLDKPPNAACSQEMLVIIIHVSIDSVI